MRHRVTNIEEFSPNDRVAQTGDRPEERPGGAIDSEALWGVSELAAYLRISPNSIYKMTARKAVFRIPHIRIGGKLRFRRADVDEWLTLLTVSNLETLSRVRKKASEAGHGNHP